MSEREPNPLPRASSTNPRKRARIDNSGSQDPVITSAVSIEDAQEIHDMWDVPCMVSKDTWAVTRCLEIHGNSATRWTPAHFVAVAMWSGGIKAGMQAAKAIRVFGIWSPHVRDEYDGISSMDVETGRDQILSKIWPTSRYE